MQILKIVLAISIALFVKFFVLQPFIIPSSSMDTTLIKGDYVLVDKWQNSLFGNLLKIENGDVIAFHYPLEKGPIKDKMVFIKRCLALPGDSLRITNGETISDPKNLQFDYLVTDPSKSLNWELLNPIGVHLGGKTTKDRWFLSLDRLQISKLQQVDSTFIFDKTMNINKTLDISTFPSDTSLHWNRDFYGPIYIPEINAEIELDINNFKLYKKIITEYENHQIRVEGNSIYIDEKLVNSYTFQQNYYFMLGDNRHHSQDSRYWGFVPENHIIGDCSTILFNAEEFSFKRLFKTVY